ncbi:hypothetical protein ACRDNQ_15875 [Palleronia sp. KMU-117]|uniref:hypothetical protein n=1 Tax=Palleronia sp. KMU-117 TaxID=3434108 RepID=UPI003D75FD72
MPRSRTSFDDVVKQAQEMVALNPVAAPQMEQFWRAQDRMLDAAEAFSQGWFQRRHEATKAAIGVARTMKGSGGARPDAAARALTEWQRDSVERLAEDFQGWIEFCTRCAGHMSDAQIEVGKEGLESVEKRAGAATGLRHATPV